MSQGTTNDSPPARADQPSTATRFANCFWLAVAVVALALGFIQSRVQMLDGQSLLQSKTVWVTVAGALGALWVRYWARPAFRLNLLALVGAAMFMEMVLQVLGWNGLLPMVNTKERIPFGRVLWTGEGLGNSIRNRAGWYFPEFDLSASNRIALIGDSFVEAVEVHRRKNMGAVLGTRLSAASPDAAVLSFGNHGTGPGHYLEVLKYAQRYYGISEAIIVIYLGNDITDCSAALQAPRPAPFMFYTRLPDGSLILPPKSEQHRSAYEHNLESLRRPFWLFLPRLVSSHSMLVQLPLSIRNAMLLGKQMRIGETSALDTELANLGLKAAPFAVVPSIEVNEAMTILESLLELADTFAREKGIKLRVVTVPFFPPEFYAQTNTTWTSRLGDYDFLGPEERLRSWAARRKIPFLALGERMRAQQLTPQEIRALYFSNGSGHFSEAGHLFAAEAIHLTFFSQNKP